MYVFYKALPLEDLRKTPFVPGTVTRDYDEAYVWWERYNSSNKKNSGAARHLRKKPAVIIKFAYSCELEDADEFQKSGVSEHSRKNCWTSAAKTKAQINTPVSQWEIVLEQPKQFK